jgi:hypothetical protein
MAVAFIMDFPGGTLEDYDWVIERMQLNGRLPAGALFHAVGQTEDGIRVCDVWESADVFQRFADTQIGPLTTERGMSPPNMRSFETAEPPRRNPAGGAVRFVQIVKVPVPDHAAFVEMDKRIVGEDRQAPEGCVFHVNGAMDGAYYVMDYWTSKEVRDAFIERNIKPAMQQAGITEMPVFEEMIAHNALTEPAQQAAGV